MVRNKGHQKMTRSIDLRKNLNRQSLLFQENEDQISKSDSFYDIPEYLHNKNQEFVHKFIGTAKVNLINSQDTDLDKNIAMMEFQKMQNFQNTKNLIEMLMIQKAKNMTDLTKQIELKLEKDKGVSDEIVKGKISMF